MASIPSSTYAPPAPDYSARRQPVQLPAASPQTGSAAEPATGRTVAAADTPDRQLGIQPSTGQGSAPAVYSADGSQPKEDPQLQAAVARLKSIEEKVKAHEAAHKSAGGTMTGPVSYSYTRGPDGRNYITGGEVPISVSPGKTPQETVSRMQQVIQAALAPGDPSPQDRAVAAQAAAQQQQASQQIASQAAAPDSSSPSVSGSDKPLPGGPSEKSDGTDKPTASGQAAATPGDQTTRPDPATVQYSRNAYSDPAAAGRTENTSEATPNSDARINAPALSGVTRPSLAALTPASITGFGAYQPVSYHA